MSGFIDRWFAPFAVLGFIVAGFDVLPIAWQHDKFATLVVGLSVLLACLEILSLCTTAWAEHLERKAEEKQ